MPRLLGRLALAALASLAACGPTQQAGHPGAGARSERTSPRNTGADRTAAQLEHGDIVMAGADSQRGTRFDSFSREVVAPPAHETPRPSPGDVAQRVKDALAIQHDLSQPPHISVTPVAGGVVLSGVVPTAEQHRIAVDTARRAAAPLRVFDQLKEP